MKSAELNKKMKEIAIKVLHCLASQILITLYVDENMVFKQIKVNEHIPFDNYIDDLGLREFAQYLDINQLDGNAIENGHVKNRPYDEVCFKFFKDKIDSLFDKAPKYNANDNYADDICHYKYGLYEYLKNLYLLFRDIISIEVSPEFFAAIPDIINKTEQCIYYNKIAKFITAIKLKHLRQGSCVDRYIKDIPFIPTLIQRLLKKQKGHFILANNDTDGLDYKFALFSCFHLYNEYNAKLLELKILRWEELNR